MCRAGHQYLNCKGSKGKNNSSRKVSEARRDVQEGGDKGWGIRDRSRLGKKKRETLCGTSLAATHDRVMWEERALAGRGKKQEGVQLREKLGEES